MKVAVEYLIDEPARNCGAADGCHFFGRLGGSVTVDMGGEPRGYLAPVAADVEGEVVDGAVKAAETVGVFVVVEGGAGLGEALVGEGILELLDLSVFVEIVFLYFSVFVL